MEGLWGPILGLGVGLGMLVASRRYIDNAEEFASTSPDAKRKAFWSTVARGERMTLPIAWALIAGSIVILVVRLLQ